MDNIIEIAPYLKTEKEEPQEPPPEDLEGVLLVQFTDKSCEFRLGFSEGESDFLPLTPELVDITIGRLFEIIEILCEEFDLDY